MKVDFDAEIKGVNGEAFTQPTMQNGERVSVPVTLGMIAADKILATATEEDREISAFEKCRRGNLALQIYSGEADLSIEDVAFIKTRIGELCDPLLVARCWAIIDPKDEATVKAKPKKAKQDNAPARGLPNGRPMRQN